MSRSRRREDSEQEELEELFRFLSLWLEFTDRRGIFPAPVIAAGRQGVESAYKAGSLSGLRMARRDIATLTAELDSSARREWEATVQSELGLRPGSLLLQDLGIIQQVLRRGAIETEDEYYLVRSRLDQIDGDAVHGQEEEQLHRLAAVFEGNRD